MICVLHDFLTHQNLLGVTSDSVLVAAVRKYQCDQQQKYKPTGQPPVIGN